MTCQCRECNCQKRSDSKILVLGYKPGDVVSLCTNCWAGHIEDFQQENGEPF